MAHALFPSYSSARVYSFPSPLDAPVQQHPRRGRYPSGVISLPLVLRKHKRYLELQQEIIDNTRQVENARYVADVFEERLAQTKRSAAVARLDAARAWCAKKYER